MLCRLCSQEARTSRLSRGTRNIVSLEFITKKGNVALWVCPNCGSFFCKHYKQVGQGRPPILGNAMYFKGRKQYEQRRSKE